MDGSEGECEKSCSRISFNTSLTCCIALCTFVQYSVCSQSSSSAPITRASTMTSPMPLHGSSHTEKGHLLYTCAFDIIKCLSKKLTFEFMMAHGDKTSWQRTNILVGGHVALSTSTTPRSNWRASTSPWPLRCGRRPRSGATSLCMMALDVANFHICSAPLLLTTSWVSASTSEIERLRKLMASRKRRWGLSLLGHKHCKDENREYRCHWRRRQSLKGPTCERSHHHRRVTPKHHCVGEARYMSVVQKTLFLKSSMWKNLNFLNFVENSLFLFFLLCEDTPLSTETVFAKKSSFVQISFSVSCFLKKILLSNFHKKLFIISFLWFFWKFIFEQISFSNVALVKKRNSLYLLLIFFFVIKNTLFFNCALNFSAFRVFSMFSSFCFSGVFSSCWVFPTEKIIKQIPFLENICFYTLYLFWTFLEEGNILNIFQKLTFEKKNHFFSKIIFLFSHASRIACAIEGSLDQCCVSWRNDHFCLFSFPSFHSHVACPFFSPLVLPRRSDGKGQNTSSRETSEGSGGNGLQDLIRRSLVVVFLSMTKSLSRWTRINQGECVGSFFLAKFGSNSVFLVIGWLMCDTDSPRDIRKWRLLSSSLNVLSHSLSIFTLHVFPPHSRRGKKLLERLSNLRRR